MKSKFIILEKSLKTEIQTVDGNISQSKQEYSDIVD